MQDTILYSYDLIEGITEETIDLINYYWLDNGIKAKIDMTVDKEGSVGMLITYEYTEGFKAQVILAIGVIIGTFCQGLNGKPFPTNPHT